MSVFGDQKIPERGDEAERLGNQQVPQQPQAEFGLVSKQFRDCEVAAELVIETSIRALRSDHEPNLFLSHGSGQSEGAEVSRLKGFHFGHCR